MAQARPPDPDELSSPARPPRWGLGDVLGGLLTSAVVPLGVAFVVFGGGRSRVSGVWVVVVFALATWTGLVTWTLMASYAKGARSIGQDFGWSFEGSDVGRGVAFGVGALVLTGIAISLLVDEVPRPDEGLLAFRPDGPVELVTLAAVVVVGAPVVEELFFRGLFLRSAERRLGTAPAVLATSVVFGLVHIPDRAGFGIGLAFLPPFVLGVVLAWLAVRTGRLGSSVIAHVSVNAVAFAGLWLVGAQS